MTLSKKEGEIMTASRKILALSIAALMMALPLTTGQRAWAQKAERQTMVVTDGKGVATEITGYGIVDRQYLGVLETKLVADRGASHITYQLDQIEKIAIAHSSSQVGCRLTITLRNAQAVEAEKLQGTAATVEGQTTDGGAFQMYLCDAKSIFFKN